MSNRKPDEALCSYVVLLNREEPSGDELRDLATYLTGLRTRGLDVVVLDASPVEIFASHQRVLRWVSRHLQVRPESRSAAGDVDVVRAAIALTSFEKVIVAAPGVRYAREALHQICNLLDVHEVVEPQDYLDPLPWWGGVEAARILIRRGIEPRPDHGTTFAFRRGAIASLRNLAPMMSMNHARRLGSSGAEVFAASNVFVRREPRSFREWVGDLPRCARDDFALPMKTAFFLSLLPLFAILIALGGSEVAGGYAGLLAFTSIALAIRGRSGAAGQFPLRACLFAPLCMVERSVSVYWAVVRLVADRESHERSFGATNAGSDASSRAAGRSH